MPISGVVIKCQMERLGDLERELHRPGSVEISNPQEGGTLIAVIESATLDEEISLVQNIMALPGVLDVRVAYHNFEDQVFAEQIPIKEEVWHGFKQT